MATGGKSPDRLPLFVAPQRRGNTSARLAECTAPLSSNTGMPHVSAREAHPADAPRWYPLARLLFLGTLVASAHAQPPLPIQSSDAHGAQIFAESGTTGMVMVVVREADVQFTSYGETSPGSSQRPGPQSLVRLCSLTKIFTTDLLVHQVRSGATHLTDPLQNFAPLGAVVPTQTIRGTAARALTLGDLATHTSGLVREVGPYPINTPHFTFPSFEDRWAWLRHHRLLTAPGTAARYSNVGFDFLGDALSAANGRPYRDLLRDQISAPLGLRDTTLTPTAEQCARLLRGSKEEGPCTDTQASAGSGGIYSTSADMARFLQSLLHARGMPSQPASALAVYLDPARLTSVEGLDHAGTPSGIGLGWIRLGDPGSPSMIIEKTGGGAGFATYMALSPARHVGIFVAATEGSGTSTGNFFEKVNDLLADVAGVPQLPASLYPVPPIPKVTHRVARARRTQSATAKAKHPKRSVR